MKKEQVIESYNESLKTCEGAYPRKGDKTFCVFCKALYTEWRESGGLESYKICQECNFKRWCNIVDIGGNVIKSVIADK
tara:strand:- start:40 stop:276 length:237 start_codon:yes stop_codon:yes gene_type:complete